MSVADFAIDAESKWMVAHVKSRAEKEFARTLLALGIGYFLPMEEVRDSRRRQITRPAFPSYCFFFGNASARYDALATNKICQVIEVVNQKRLVEQLTNIECAAGENGLIVGMSDIRVGVICRVKPGHWAEGMEGFIESKSKRGFFWLRVDVLGSSTPAEIPTEFLEVVEDDPQ